MSLDASDFDNFFKEVHGGNSPFKWQSELAKQVCESGKWPKALNLPTASGKTSVIDISVFHLALEATKKHDRKAPIRTAFVVDRRLVVDDAFDHALNIAKKIQEPTGPITKQVAESLKSLSTNDDEPLKVVKLRGGMAQENDWNKTPTQPLVIISTIDQVGSRLLFRGYGVSYNMRPIHAGLLGTDIMYILDEAHTSQPFVDTLTTIQNIRDQYWKSVLRPIKFMFMSATLTNQNDDDDVFPEKKDVKRILYGDDRISKRLSAHKYAKLKKVSDKDQIDQFVKSALELAKPDNVKSIGVVVNRVNIAREIFTQLRQKIGDENNNEQPQEVHLLIGRSRPFDRDTFVKNKINQIRVEDEDKDDSKTGKMFFVATQCIEVGVDISFDALVTQIAPIDSLCQRFGRLNRTGNRAEGSEAVIIATKTEISEISGKKPDPIYKDSLNPTWKYLENLAQKKDDTIDVGIEYLKKPDDNEMLAPKIDSVTLLPAYIRFWMQTKPPPSPDPAPQFFLHGKDTKSPDVQVIWRADVTEDMLESKKKKDALKQCSHTFISIPSSLEAVSVPIWTVKKWLADMPDDDVSDIEGVSEQNSTPNNHTTKMKKVILWCGKNNKDTRIINYSDITPADTIIVPATYGGCDEYGWDSTNKDKVRDIGTESNLVHKRRLTMRFNEQVVTASSSSKTWDAINNILQKYKETTDVESFIKEMYDVDGLPVLWKHMLELVKKNPKSVQAVKTTDIDTYRISGIEYKKKLQVSEIENIFADDNNLYQYEIQEDHSAESSTDEEYESKRSVGTIELIEHCKGVRDRVVAFGLSIGLDKNILDDIKMAAFLHDSGKAERRVQAFLRKQDPDELYESTLIAKSTSSIDSKDDYEKFPSISHLPKGYRHECWSVNLAKNHPDIKNANDRDLVLYLIGTHHGHGRPLFPPINDVYASVHDTFSFDGVKVKSDYSIAQLDSEWIEIFERLYKKYDPWDLAYMESLIRLADHRQSEAEAKQ